MALHKSKYWKILLAIAIVVLGIGGFVYYRTMNMAHRDVREEKGIGITAQAIADAYAADEKKADSLYLDKAIEVSGVVSSVSKNQQGKTVVALQTNDPMAGVRCTLKEDAEVKEGSTVKIKGKCSGYLMDVTIIDCYIEN